MQPSTLMDEPIQFMKKNCPHLCQEIFDKSLAIELLFTRVIWVVYHEQVVSYDNKIYIIWHIAGGLLW